MGLLNMKKYLQKIYEKLQPGIELFLGTLEELMGWIELVFEVIAENDTDFTDDED